MKKDWETKSLGEICEIYQPKTISTKEMVPNGKYVVYGANGIIGRYDKYNHEEPQLLITCRGATCGYVNISTPQAWITGNAMVVRPKNSSIDLKFIEYLFRGGLDLSKTITGAAQPQITRTTLAPLSISYPKSLAEQQRIVTILDEAFVAITKAKENVAMNLQNARTIFKSQLQSTFDKAWQEFDLVPLSDLATDITDGDHMPPPKSITGIPFITIGNIVKDTRKIDFTDTFKVSHKYFYSLKESKRPRRGDLLYTLTGSFGIPVIVDDDIDFCFQRHIGLIRPKPETNSLWLYYLLLSPKLFQQANEQATGTAQKTVSLKVLRGFVVPNVSIEQQQTTVVKLNKLFEITQLLESRYQQKLDNLEELKKSISQKAFSGELAEAHV